MKKYSLSILIILLCSVLVFSGCTKAKTATPASINMLYQSIAQQYGSYDNQEKIKVFDNNKSVDLYSNASYNSTVYGEIVHLQDEASYSTLNMLDVGQEYQTIMAAVSCFYQNRTLIDITENVPQELYTNMYQSIDDLTPILKEVLSKKESLESTLYNLGASQVNSAPVKESLKSFLSAYKKLIEKHFEFNAVFEDIYTTYIYSPTGKEVKLKEGELQRLVLSSAVYLGQYYYLKQMVLNSNLDNRFSHQKLYNSSTNAVEMNQNYDESFEGLKKIVENLLMISDPVNLNDADYLTYYNASVEKLKSFKTNVNNYKIAVENILSYKKSHNNQDVPTDSATYQYVQFANNMEIEVQNLQNYLIINIIKV